MKEKNANKGDFMRVQSGRLLVDVIYLSACQRQQTSLNDIQISHWLKHGEYCYKLDFLANVISGGRQCGEGREAREKNHNKIELTKQKKK